MTKRPAIVFATALGLVTFPSILFSAKAADDFPAKELTILVNYGAGGGVDRTARSVQPFLPEALGQNVIVRNEGGAGGKVGLRKYMQEKPDGYTVLAAFAPATTYAKFTNPDLFSMDDLALINVQWTDPAILLANKDTGWKTLGDMVDAVRKNPDKYTFGSSGKGSVGPVLTRALFRQLGLDVKSVPYKGGGATRKAFAGGEVDMTAGGAAGELSIKDSAVVLGIFWPKAINSWPDATPINEALKPYDATVPDGGAYRFFAVHSEFKKDHPEQFKTLVDAFRKTVLKNEAFRKNAKKSGVGTDWLGPKKSQKLIKEVDERFTKILKQEK